MSETPNTETRRHARQTKLELPLTFRNTEPYSPSGTPPEGAPDWLIIRTYTAFLRPLTPN
jgi:hypothetical protein